MLYVAKQRWEEKLNGIQYKFPIVFMFTYKVTTILNCGLLRTPQVVVCMCVCVYVVSVWGHVEACTV